MKVPKNVELFSGTFEQMFAFSKFQDLPAGFIFFTDAVTEAEHNKKIDDYIAGYGVNADQFSKICHQSGCIMHFTWLDKDGHHLIDRMVFGVAKRNPKVKFIAVTDAPALIELMAITEKLPDLQPIQGMKH